MSAVAVTRRDTKEPVARPETPIEVGPSAASDDSRPRSEGVPVAPSTEAADNGDGDRDDDRGPDEQTAVGGEPPLDDLNEAFARAAAVVRAREGATEASDSSPAAEHRSNDDSVPVFEASRPLAANSSAHAARGSALSEPAPLPTRRPAPAPSAPRARTQTASDTSAEEPRAPDAEGPPSASDDDNDDDFAPRPSRAQTRSVGDYGVDSRRRLATRAETVAPWQRPRRATNPPNPTERAAEALAVHRRRRTPRYRSLLWRWFASWFRRPTSAVFAPLPTVNPGQLSVSFAGHASALVRYHNLSIACDPMLGSWHKGIRRSQQPGLSPAEFADVDLVLLSHADPVHMHRETLAQLPRAATVVLPPQTAQNVSDLGFARVIELGIGQSLQLRRVDIRTTATRHTGRGDTKALSYVIRGEGPSVFFCGDSGYFSGFAEIGRRYQPDVALLPIGGYSPRSFRDRHMSPLDALNAFEDLQARALVPIRYGAFPLSYEQLHDPARWLAELIHERDLDPYVAPLEPGASRIFTLPPGERGRARRASSRP